MVQPLTSLAIPHLICTLGDVGLLISVVTSEEGGLEPPGVRMFALSITFGTLLLPFWAQVDKSTRSAWWGVSKLYCVAV
jgi:hypothetical protein